MTGEESIESCRREKSVSKTGETVSREFWVGVGINLGDPWIVIKWYVVMCILRFIDTYYVGVIGEIKQRIGQWDSGEMILNPVHALVWLIRKDKNNKN
jgi:hypothetical protein